MTPPKPTGAPGHTESTEGCWMRSAVCRTYAEVELADLPVREGKEARGWLTSAHQDAERAREHISEHIRRREGSGHFSTLT